MGLEFNVVAIQYLGGANLLNLCTHLSSSPSSWCWSIELTPGLCSRQNLRSQLQEVVEAGRGGGVLRPEPEKKGNLQYVEALRWVTRSDTTNCQSRHIDMLDSGACRHGMGVTCDQRRGSQTTYLRPKIKFYIVGRPPVKWVALFGESDGIASVLCPALVKPRMRCSARRIWLARPAVLSGVSTGGTGAQQVPCTCSSPKCLGPHYPTAVEVDPFRQYPAVLGCVGPRLGSFS